MIASLTLLLAVAAPAALAPAGKPLPATPAFVIADVVNLRKRPSPDATIVQQLRSGAPVTVTPSTSGWVTVTAHLGSGRVVTGFAKAELLDGAPLDVTRTKVGAQAALGAHKLDDALRLAQRAAAAAPDDADALALLRDALRARTEEARAEAVEATLAGRSRVHVALCVEGTGAVVVLQIDGASRRSTLPCGLVGEGGTVGSTIDVVEARPLAKALAVEPWFKLSADASVRRVDALTFADPRVQPELDEPGAGGVSEAPRIVLGPCDEPGAVFLTAPIVGVQEPTSVFSSWRDSHEDTTSDNVDDQTLVKDARFGAFLFGGLGFGVVTTNTSDPSGGGSRGVGWMNLEPDGSRAKLLCELSMRSGC